MTSLRLENGSDSLSLVEWNTIGRRHPLETVWNVTLILVVFASNVFVILIVGTSQSLWRPRHLFMVALCVTNILFGLAQQLLGLAAQLWPEWGLCVIYQMTIGIPVQVHNILLTFISMYRFEAVKFPFLYASDVNNLQVIEAT